MKCCNTQEMSRNFVFKLDRPGCFCKDTLLFVLFILKFRTKLEEGQEKQTKLEEGQEKQTRFAEGCG